MSPEITTTVITAVPATIAALAAWRSTRRTDATLKNGVATQVGEIRQLILNHLRYHKEI